MPRKAAAPTAEDGDVAEGPRRSTRISSQPNAGTEVKEKKPRAASKTGTKRSAEDQGTSTQKKAKGDEKDGESPTDKEEQPKTPKPAKIDIGDQLPSLTLKNEKDEDVDVGSLASEKGVVLFLVPKADTPGCTTQACGYRDIYPDFTSVNYEVYCLSADTVSAQSKWQTKKSLPYPLLSDRKRVLIGALGASDGGKTKRSHFIFEKGGKLIDRQVPVKAADRLDKTRYLLRVALRLLSQP
jgi:peroxiredoxin Q/BCP